MDLTDEEISLPGYGMPITASTNQDCVPNALFDQYHTYVLPNHQTDCAIHRRALVFVPAQRHPTFPRIRVSSKLNGRHHSDPVPGPLSSQCENML